MLTFSYGVLFNEPGTSVVSLDRDNFRIFANIKILLIIANFIPNL